jgi:hypothetical protein
MSRSCYWFPTPPTWPAGVALGGCVSITRKVALITDHILEGARDARSVAELMVSGGSPADDALSAPRAIVNEFRCPAEAFADIPTTPG